MLNMGATTSSRQPSVEPATIGEIHCLNDRYPMVIHWTIRHLLLYKKFQFLHSPTFLSNDGMQLWQLICAQSKNGKELICGLLLVKNKFELKGDKEVMRPLFYVLNVPEAKSEVDELVIICNIACKDSATQKYIYNIKFLNNFKTGLLELLGDFGELLRNSELSDVHLLSADGKVFKVHKAVLAARSKVFFAMFKNNMLENRTNIVKIEDFNGFVLEQLLKFIYTAKIDYTDDQDVKDIFLAADKYDIGALKRECLDYLQRSVNISNAVGLLEFAEKYGVNDLKVAAQTFIVKNAKVILQQPDFDLNVLDANAINDLFRTMAITFK